MFITLLFKLGICQCVVKSICKMSCAACAAYCFAIGEMVSCLWHSLTNIKRVRHRRKRLGDIEATMYDYPSDGESSSSDSPSRINNIRPKQRRRRLGSKHNHHHQGSNRNNRRLIRLSSRQLSVRVGGKSRRVRRSARKTKSRRVKILKVKDVVD